MPTYTESDTPYALAVSKKLNDTDTIIFMAIGGKIINEKVSYIRLPLINYTYDPMNKAFMKLNAQPAFIVLDVYIVAYNFFRTLQLDYTTSQLYIYTIDFGSSIVLAKKTFPPQPTATFMLGKFLSPTIFIVPVNISQQFYNSLSAYKVINNSKKLSMLLSNDEFQSCYTFDQSSAYTIDQESVLNTGITQVYETIFNRVTDLPNNVNGYYLEIYQATSTLSKKLLFNDRPGILGECNSAAYSIEYVGSATKQQLTSIEFASQTEQKDFLFTEYIGRSVCQTGQGYSPTINVQSINIVPVTMGYDQFSLTHNALIIGNKFLNITSTSDVYGTIPIMLKVMISDVNIAKYDTIYQHVKRQEPAIFFRTNTKYNLITFCIGQQFIRHLPLIVSVSTKNYVWVIDPNGIHLDESLVNVTVQPTLCVLTIDNSQGYFNVSYSFLYLKIDDGFQNNTYQLGLIVINDQPTLSPSFDLSSRIVQVNQELFITFTKSDIVDYNNSGKFYIHVDTSEYVKSFTTINEIPTTTEIGSIYVTPTNNGQVGTFQFYITISDGFLDSTQYTLEVVVIKEFADPFGNQYLGILMNRVYHQTVYFEYYLSQGVVILSIQEMVNRYMLTLAQQSIKVNMKENIYFCSFEQGMLYMDLRNAKKQNFTIDLVSKKGTTTLAITILDSSHAYYTHTDKTETDQGQMITKLTTFRILKSGQDQQMTLYIENIVNVLLELDNLFKIQIEGMTFNFPNFKQEGQFIYVKLNLSDTEISGIQSVNSTLSLYNFSDPLLQSPQRKILQFINLGKLNGSSRMAQQLQKRSRNNQQLNNLRVFHQCRALYTTLASD